MILPEQTNSGDAGSKHVENKQDLEDIKKSEDEMPRRRLAYNNEEQWPTICFLRPCA
jgi:hypothetical protein